MKKQSFFLLTVFLLITVVTANAQRAWKLNHKKVAEIKRGPVYFILSDFNEIYNNQIKETFDKHWTFCEVKFEYEKNFDEIRKKKNVTVMGLGIANQTLGKMTIAEKRNIRSSTPHDLAMQTRPGVTTKVGGIIISRRVKNNLFVNSTYWDGAFYTNLTTAIDIEEFYKIPLHIKVLNKMLHTIEDNKTSKFHWKRASNIYKKNKPELADRTLYILKRDLPKSNKEEDFQKIETINQYYKHKVKIVNNEELEKAIDEDQDVAYLHIFPLDGFTHYSAISCKTGEIFSLSMKAKKSYKKVFKLILKDMSN